MLMDAGSVVLMGAGSVMLMSVFVVKPGETQPLASKLMMLKNNNLLVKFEIKKDESRGCVQAGSENIKSVLGSRVN